MPAISERLQPLLQVPGRGSGVAAEEGGFRCSQTGEAFPFVNDVPSLFFPAPGDDDGIIDRVRSFYEENPFPSYEGIEEFGDLVTKGHGNPFSRDLLDAIGFNKLILECGCGTGQLSHYLQLNNNHVLGIDMSLASLRLAIEHKRRNQLRRASFAQMNIFNLAVRDSSFDVVISHGVLHHTRDARAAFAEIVRKVKPGGIVVLGLYNYYARVPTWIRSKLIGLVGSRIDYVVRHRIQDQRKAEIWIKDQYYNPHETWHSIDETLSWFSENNVEFLNCHPPILGSSGENSRSFFGPSDTGSSYTRVATQLGWLGTISREGALFDVIGRRRS